MSWHSLPPLFWGGLSVYGPKDSLITPKTKMTNVETITKFLILRNMAVTGLLRQNCDVIPAVPLPRVRIWYGSGCTTIARAQHGGRASKRCEHGFRIFWKGRCVSGWAVPDVSKGGSAVIFKRQPSMTKCYVPSKRREPLIRQHTVISQETLKFGKTAVKTS